ncbi:MAG: hypothetical protein K2K06_07640 [Oscillospiraceae bacterium]|nr:hypothetical protein [Oscillospiraceae bacterium]
MLKVEHKGVTDKSKFHISTTDMQAEVLEKEINTIKAENEEEHARECQHGKVTIDLATFAIDNDINISYAPQLTSTVDEDNTKSQGEIILDFNEN